MGRAFFQIAGVFAELERGMINARTKAGIIKARNDGVKFGRVRGSKNKTTPDKHDKIKIFLKAGKSYDWITKELCVSKKTIAEVKKSIMAISQLIPDKKESHTKSELIKNEPLTRKVAIVDVWLQVENNSKDVRGKNESRQRIEQSCFDPFNMIKKGNDSWEYQLTIPYDTDDELDEVHD